MSNTVQLFEFDDYPGRIAISRVQPPVSGSAFFLDFTRKIEKHRWFGMNNRWIGRIRTLTVPVIHECESEGGFVIAVHRDEPMFEELLSIWKSRFPSTKIEPRVHVSKLEIIADWGLHFPDGF